MVQFKNTLKFLDIILTMWWYCIIPEDRINAEKTRLTLHAVTNEDDFSDGSGIGEKRDVIPNFYLRGFINNNSVKRGFSKYTLSSQCITREHAECAKHNWGVTEFKEPLKKFTTGDDIGPERGI